MTKRTLIPPARWCGRLQPPVKLLPELVFPSIPFIPSQTYEVLDTDYNNYAIVSGSYDDSFIQVYSREPHISRRKLDNYKNKLKKFGINPNILKNTPQDCTTE